MNCCALRIILVVLTETVETACCSFSNSGLPRVMGNEKDICVNYKLVLCFVMLIFLSILLSYCGHVTVTELQFTDVSFSCIPVSSFNFCISVHKLLFLFVFFLSAFLFFFIFFSCLLPFIFVSTNGSNFFKNMLLIFGLRREILDKYNNINLLLFFIFVV